MSRWFPERAVWRIELRVSDAQPAAMERELDALSPRPGTRLTCVIAGDGVRYRIVPWSEELSRPAQRQRLAEQCFHEAYGDVARTWTVRQHAVRHGAATLACAIDSSLLDQLDASTRSRSLKLVSVQPSLMCVYNDVRRHIEPGLHWFVAVESDWTTLLLQSRTEPLQVKRQPTSGDDLPRLLDREWFALGIEAPRCPVYVVRSTPMSMSDRALSTSSTGWQINDVSAAAGVTSTRSVAAQSACGAHP